MENMLSAIREYGRLEKLREQKGLSVEELERWTHLKRILASHFKPGTGNEIADKQSSLRVPSQLQVSFDSYGNLRECLMTNISRGGVFVATSDPLPIGTPFKLRIKIADPEEIHELSGEVASVNAGRDMKSEDRGMGIRFCHLNEQQQAVVERLYGQAMDAMMKKVSK
jgi:uncharacterized protein (TIGR02266 family)